MSKEYLLKGGRIIDPARKIDQVGDIGIRAGRLVDPAELVKPEVVDIAGLVAAPGFLDLHVHLRQPGNPAAETIASGTRAAAAGGFTTIVAMPNTNPPADTAAEVEYIRQLAAKSGAVKVLACGCLTKNREGREMAGIGALAKAGVVALSDDGGCVQDHALMRHIAEYAMPFHLPILEHCEETQLAAGGVMHEGKWSVLLGMRGISSAAEELIVARDILLARMTGTRFHMQHVSTAGSVELIRQARKEGLPVTGEVTPHHLSLTDECIKTYDTNYKMNPPLRSESDRQALLAGLADGTLTAIATDHAPHTEMSKLVEFDAAPFGIIGLETALAVSLTYLYHTKVLTLPQLIAKLTCGPAEVIASDAGTLEPGRPADVTVFDPDRVWTVDPEQFESQSRNTPYGGMELKGKVIHTFVDGRPVFRDGAIH